MSKASTASRLARAYAVLQIRAISPKQHIAIHHFKHVFETCLREPGGHLPWSSTWHKSAGAGARKTEMASMLALHILRNLNATVVWPLRPPT